MSTREQNLLFTFEESWKNNFAHENANWLLSLRRKNLDAFLKKGLPTTKDEDWKYTSLSTLHAQNLSLWQSNVRQIEKKDIKITANNDHYSFVFIDGFFVPNLSSSVADTKIILLNLAQAFDKYSSTIESFIAQQNVANAFTHLNSACAEDGIFIHVPTNCKIDKPIHLIFLTSDQAANSLQNIRNIILVDKNAHLTLVEEHRSLTENTYLTNVVTQLAVEQDAHVNYTKLQHQNNYSYHIGYTESCQKKNSQIFAKHYSLGSMLSRDDFHCYLQEQCAALQLQGLYLPLYKQHMDLHTYIYHQANNTQSEELFKGLIGKKSRAVFNGKIQVEKHIKQAIANLQNKNLLLASDAEVNTKPELEIYSDDVKCKHGATVGQIDKQMLFYLRSRGIEQEKAYQLLLLAFVREQLTAISDESIVDQVLNTVTQYCEEVM